MVIFCRGLLLSTESILSREYKGSSAREINGKDRLNLHPITFLSCSLFPAVNERKKGIHFRHNFVSATIATAIVVVDYDSNCSNWSFEASTRKLYPIITRNNRNLKNPPTHPDS